MLEGKMKCVLVIFSAFCEDKVVHDENMDINYGNSYKTVTLQYKLLHNLY